MNKKVLYLVHGAVIAALYVVLTMLANWQIMPFRSASRKP